MSQWLALDGFLLALGGFVVNTWYKIAMYRLEKAQLGKKTNEQ